MDDNGPQGVLPVVQWLGLEDIAQFGVRVVQYRARRQEDGKLRERC